VRAQSARASAASSRKKTANRARTASAARPATRARESEGPSVAEHSPSPKRTVISTMKELPNFLRLIGGLLTDVRVSTTDKLLVAGAIGYVFLPMDLVPDFIPFIGEIDDVFLLVLALQRLIANADRSVVLEHWMGDPRQLRSLDLERVLVAAAVALLVANTINIAADLAGMADAGEMLTGINSHLLVEVELFCREVAILHKGKVALQGTVKELTSGRGYRLSAAAVPERLSEELRTRASAMTTRDGMDEFHFGTREQVNEALDLLRAIRRSGETATAPEGPGPWAALQGTLQTAAPPA